MALPKCSFSTRCDQCRGKGLEKCSVSACGGSGWVQCTQCNGRGRTETAKTITICGCSNGRVRCSTCKGGGKVHCSNCSGCGGFYHSVILKAEWHTRTSTWYCQNSFLPEKQISKAHRTLYWSNQQQPWSKNSSIDGFIQYLQQDERKENIQLKKSIVREYQEEHLKPTAGVKNRMSRLVCTIERLDFEEVHYTLDNEYTNKKHPELGTTFRFCKFPVNGKGQVIYENEYPLNCCGCFGNKCACYSCCCSIL
ncbi:hypothetical protein I4U23_027094 [Adineta vaga]|nr:hypothetical protein I4U23_027094 [Adineta vaga]